MDSTLTQIEKEIYTPCGLVISAFRIEEESQEYFACQFQLNKRNIISRNSKITPTKTGQFVTFWKRNPNGPIEPFSETDSVDFFVVNSRTNNKLGQFVFPKSVLIEKGILSTNKKEGKRAFRVYPSWDIATNKQAVQSQKWQLDYFYEIGSTNNLEKVRTLYSKH